MYLKYLTKAKKPTSLSRWTFLGDDSHVYEGENKNSLSFDCHLMDLLNVKSIKSLIYRQKVSINLFIILDHVSSRRKKDKWDHLRKSGSGNFHLMLDALWRIKRDEFTTFLKKIIKNLHECLTEPLNVVSREWKEIWIFWRRVLIPWMQPERMHPLEFHRRLLMMHVELSMEFKWRMKINDLLSLYFRKMEQNKTCLTDWLEISGIIKRTAVWMIIFRFSMGRRDGRSLAI